MDRTKQLKNILLGMLLSALIFSLASPALAALTSKTIEVYSGVNIYIDDQKLEPTDVNGNSVEVFAYNGTTYLPIRAVSEALGKPVQWEGKTSSVYVGKHTGEKPAVWLSDMDYYSKQSFYDYSFKFLSSEVDSLGNKHQNIITRSIGDYGGMWYRYRINGQYSAISGVFFHPYSERDYGQPTTLNIYGDDELLYTATVQGGSDPIDPIPFHVDLTGVLELKVELTGYYFDTGSRYATPGCIGECGLWT